MLIKVRLVVGLFIGVLCIRFRRVFIFRLLVFLLSIKLMVFMRFDLFKGEGVKVEEGILGRREEENK